MFGRFPLLASRFINRFASSFLTTVGCTLLIASTPFVFAVSTPSYLLLGLLTLSHYLLPHRFSLFFVAFSSSVAFGVWSISAFLASAALSIFCFVFLNNRWLDIVNESKPFDFAVSTLYLLTVYRILSLLLLHRLSLFCFSSSVAFGVWSISAFLASPLYQSFCFVFLNNRWLDIVNLNHLISQCLHFVICYGLLTLSHYYGLIDFRFSLPSLHLSHQVFDRFLLS